MRRQRRGVLGCTNLPVLTHHCEAHADSRHLIEPGGTLNTLHTATNTTSSAVQRVGAQRCDNVNDKCLRKMTKQRENLKLPLISSTSGTAIQEGQCSHKRKPPPREPQLSEAELALSTAIEAHESGSKSFKDEYWYTSPVGFGSKKSVVLSALKARDPTGSGVITCRQFVEALQAPNLGLNEAQVRSLLTDFSSQIQNEDAQIPYRSFVNHLRLPEDHSNQAGQDPTIFYQQSYVNRVRTHAAQLVESVAVVNLESSASNASAPKTHLVNCSSTGSMSLSPVVGSHASPTRSGDRLSFELDKERKQRRADAKSRILLAHINRIDTFSRDQHKLAEQHETMRLAAKALNRHAHFEHAFEEENRQMRAAQRDNKGLMGSPIAQMQRNVSTDSMFYVEPVLP